MPREVNGYFVLYEEQGNLAFIYSNFRDGYLMFRSTVIPRSFVHYYSTVQFDFLIAFLVDSLQIIYHHVQNTSCYAMVPKLQ
jgi:hypothetical protein